MLVVDGSAGGWEACADGRRGKRAVNSATTTVDIVTRETDIEAITIIQLRFVLVRRDCSLLPELTRLQLY
jgi:hypothetical protein